MNKHYFFIGCLLLIKCMAPVSISTVISQPGVYTFAGEIIASPTDANDAIITVTSNDVIIELAHHKFSQDPSNHVAGLTGIRVMPGVQRLTIRNGRIESLTGKGIEINDGCSGFLFDNLEIIHCLEGGMVFDGLSTGSGITFMAAQNSLIVSCSGVQSDAYGIKASYIKQFILSDLQLINSDAGLNGDGYGCYIDSGTGINFTNNTMSANGGLSKGVGGCFKNSMAIVLKNCLFNVNMSRSPSSTAYVAGAEFINCTDCQIRTCNFDKNIQPYANAYGVHMVSCQDMWINACGAQGNQGGIYGAAFNADACTRVTLGSSMFFGNKSGGTTYGIHLQNNCADCYLYGNDLASNTGATSYGILDDSVPSTNLIIQNKAYNHSYNYMITYTTGIVLPMLDGSLTNTAIGLPTGQGGHLDNINVLH